MKVKFLLPLIFLFSSGVVAQEPKGVLSFEDKEFNDYFMTQAKVPVVKGKVLNLTAEEIKNTQIRYSIVTPFEKLQATKTGALSADGSFQLTLDYAFPYQQIWLSIGELFYTGIYANTDLYIELDARVIKGQKDAAFICDGVKFLGTDGAINIYENNHTLYQRERQLELDKTLQGTIAVLRAVPVKDSRYPAFIRKYDSLFEILTQLDRAYAKQSEVGSQSGANENQYGKQNIDFSWVITNERQSQYYGNLCAIHWFKQMPPELFERVKNYKPYLTSNQGMLFYQYLFSYLQFKSASKTPGIAENTLKTIEALDSLFAPAKSDFLKLKFSSRDPNEKKIVMETVLANIKTEWCKKVIQSEYEKLGSKLKSINSVLGGSKSFTSAYELGKPVAELSFGARLYKADSINAKTLLSNLKKSFEHKAILIDLWATWCAPCIAEFPHSKTLHENAKDLPIEFVYICTTEGSSFEKWKTKIAEFELSGTHIYADKKIVNEFLEMFSGSGYPTYALVNANGEYKTNSVRPSTLTKEKLSELIK